MNDDTTPVLAFFRSQRSGPARRMESLIAHFAHKERQRLRVTIVDADTRPDLVRRFGITTVPTLLLIANRRVVGRLEGRTSAPQIERMLDEHLAPLEVPPAAAVAAA
jgi:thioredoxin-like negative regulator of GroEL